MSDLAKMVWDLGVSLNAAKAEELRVAPIVKRLKAEMKAKNIDFRTEVYVTDQDGEEWEIEIGVSYDATYTPGKFTGPWEDSYPADGSMDITEIHLIQDTPFGFTDQDVLEQTKKDKDRIEELAWEHYFSKGRDE